MSAIVPIVGKLRKRFVFDVSMALGIGSMLGYAYWYGIHVPGIQRQDAWYLKYHSAQLQNRQKDFEES